MIDNPRLLQLVQSSSEGTHRPFQEYRKQHQGEGRRPSSGPITTHLSASLTVASAAEKQALAGTFVRILAGEDLVTLILHGHPLLHKLQEMGMESADVFRQIVLAKQIEPNSRDSGESRRRAG